MPRVPFGRTETDPANPERTALFQLTPYRATGGRARARPHRHLTKYQESAPPQNRIVGPLAGSHNRPVYSL